jgi:26S proteasome regulatory subunit T1
MSSGECQTKNRNEYDKADDDAPIKALDEDDIALLKTYGIGPYANAIKNVEEDIKKYQEKVKELIGIKESDTGLSLPSQWDLVADKASMEREQPLQVARCTHSFIYSLAHSFTHLFFAQVQKLLILIQKMPNI